jgi:non-ribosomal peptide synthase protein (TIGR01720 family)
LLQEVPQIYHTQILDILLTALVQTLSQWTNTSSVLVDLEGHGREEIISGIDLSRTVGWFTTMYPVLLELKQPNNPELAIKSIKEQLRCIPDKGIGYGLLRYLSQDMEIQEKLTALPQPQVSFNYLGQMDTIVSSDTLFTLATESAGIDRSLLSGRGHLLDIGGHITGGCLKLDWMYSENVHRRTTIEALAQSFIVALQALITHCQSCEVGGYTPSDFPLTDMSQEELDTAFSSIEFEEA